LINCSFCIGFDRILRKDECQQLYKTILLALKYGGEMLLLYMCVWIG